MRVGPSMASGDDLTPGEATAASQIRSIGRRPGSGGRYAGVLPNAVAPRLASGTVTEDERRRRPSFPEPDVEPVRPPTLPRTSTASVVTIADFFSVLRRRLGAFLLVALLVLAATFGLFTSATKSFQAQSSVNVSPIIATGDTGVAKDISTVTQSRIVTSTAVGELAAKTLGYQKSITSLLQHVSVSSPLNSQLIYITYAAPTASGAASGANAFANAYLDYRQTVGEDALIRKATALAGQVSTLRKQMAQMGPKGDAATLRSLQSQVGSLSAQENAARTTVVVPGQILGVAQAPTTPTSPKKPLYLAGGVLLALVLGSVAAVLRERHDHNVHGAAEMEQWVGAPVLATVPSSRKQPKRSSGRSVARASVAVDAATVDAYRVVATKLQTPVTGKGARSFLVLPGGPVKEKLAPLNLAKTFARQGLTTALVGTVPGVAYARAELGVEKPAGGFNERVSVVPAVDGLTLVSLGSEEELDATLGASGAPFDDLIGDVRVVVLDGVNVELPSSVLTLGRLTHAAVIVAVDGRTTHGDLDVAVRELAQIGTVPLGAVLFVRAARRSLLRRVTRRRR